MLGNSGISLFDMRKGFVPTKSQSRGEEKDFVLCKAAVFRRCFLEQLYAQKLLCKLFGGKDALKKSEKLVEKLPDLWQRISSRHISSAVSESLR